MEDRTDDLIFVYGSLRRGCGNDAARVLHTGSEWIGTGWLHGSLADIDGYPALKPDAAGDRIEGDIFRMRDPDTMLPFLDIYEECAPSSPTPHDYVRVAASVVTEVGNLRAWVYIANSTR